MRLLVLKYYRVVKGMKRTAEISRKTAETDITIKLNLDGIGKYDIYTGFTFMDHMLTLLARHSGIDLMVKASGDLTHHVIEDIGIVLGECFEKAIGDKKGARQKLLQPEETAFLTMIGNDKELKPFVFKIVYKIGGISHYCIEKYFVDRLFFYSPPVNSR